MILAFDPGVSTTNATGVALLDPQSKKIVAAGIVRPDPYSQKIFEGLALQRIIARNTVSWATEHLPRGKYISTCVTEWPQVYPHERKVNPNTSLLPLCGLIGCVTGLLCEAFLVAYTPRDWKGTVNGDVFTQRILDRLDPSERSIVDQVMPAGLRHNAIDASGLGLFYLGRMGRQRVVHNES